MYSDRELISTEVHELNYLLQKWGKKKSKTNRQLLTAVVKDFKKDAQFKPHTRKKFYMYIDQMRLTDHLESAAARTIISDTSSKTNLEDEIRKRAYLLYKKRINNKQAGNHISDWLQAEKEIKKEYKRRKS